MNEFETPAERDAIRDLIARVYRAISGSAGAPRDWDALAACFVPGGGRMMPFRVGDEELAFEFLTPETYAISRKVLIESIAFYEVEIGHEATIAGRIAHAFSRYEARREPDGPAAVKGVNSIQLVRTPGGWRILSMTWQFTGLGEEKKAAG